MGPAELFARNCQSCERTAKCGGFRVATTTYGGEDVPRRSSSAWTGRPRTRLPRSTSERVLGLSSDLGHEHEPGRGPWKVLGRRSTPRHQGPSGGRDREKRPERRCRGEKDDGFDRSPDSIRPEVVAIDGDIVSRSRSQDAATSGSPEPLADPAIRGQAWVGFGIVPSLGRARSRSGVVNHGMGCRRPEPFLPVVPFHPLAFDRPAIDAGSASFQSHGPCGYPHRRPDDVTSSRVRSSPSLRVRRRSVPHPAVDIPTIKDAHR